ncbi:MAG: PIN domain-containing protein [Actinomycetia bacterium]|nr:PIN domain-containing protein [Actinomycetes bacterium]
MVTPVVLDVNILVAAHQPLHAHHDLAARWLSHHLSGATGSVVVPDIVWAGFARVTTNLHAFNPPATPQDAALFAEAVTRAPAYCGIAGLADGVQPFFGTVVRAQARGNLVTDAYIAAVALQLGAAVATFDRDFRRFDGLRIVTPAMPA